MTDWPQTIRALHDRYFEIDWGTHVDRLNNSLTPRPPAGDEFRLTTGAPPSWFEGDIESLRPGDWALVIGLNHRLPSPGNMNLSSSEDWDYWRFVNRTHRYGTFHDRPRDLAAALLGGPSRAEDVDDSFIVTRMIFTELCPYPSQHWRLSDAQTAHLVAHDMGFQAIAEVQRILIETAQPSVILVYGAPGVRVFEQTYAGRLMWHRTRYQSETDPRKTLWHNEGHLATEQRSVPVLGFAQRSASTHNSHAEWGQLAARGRQFVIGQSDRSA